MGAPPLNIEHFKMKPYKLRGDYEIVIIHAGKHRVEVTESPTGHSVQLYVNGTQVNLPAPTT